MEKQQDFKISNVMWWGIKFQNSMWTDQEQEWLQNWIWKLFVIIWHLDKWSIDEP